MQVCGCVCMGAVFTSSVGFNVQLYDQVAEHWSTTMIDDHDADNT